MARAIWKGSISFGLVNIPIELHTAVRDRRPHFRMLHAKDKSPVRFERVCIRDGHPGGLGGSRQGLRVFQGVTSSCCPKRISARRPSKRHAPSTSSTS